MTSPVRFFLGLPREAQDDLPEIPENPVPNSGEDMQGLMEAEAQARGTQGQLYAHLGTDSLQRLCSSDSETPCLQNIEANLREANLQNLGRYRDTIMALAAEVQGIQQTAQAQGMPAVLPPEIHAMTVRIINEVLNLVTLPQLDEASWSAGAGPLGIRNTTLYILFDVLQFGGAILHQNSSGELLPPHRSLLTRLAQRTLQFVSENQRQAASSDIPADQRPASLPDYLVSFVTAQVATLQGESEEAIRHLATARRQIQQADVDSPLAPNQMTGLRNQVRSGVNATLFQLASNPTAILSLNARTRTSLTALGYLTLVTRNAGTEEISQETREEQVRQLQQFQVMAAILLNDGMAGQGALQIIEAIRDFGQIDEQTRALLRQMGMARDGATQQSVDQAIDQMAAQQRQQLISHLQERYGSNPEFSEALSQMGFEGDISEADWNTIIQNAQEVATHILEHREESPYQQLFERDELGQGLTQAGEILDRHPMLRARVLQALGMPESQEMPLDGSTLAFILAHYGSETENFLNSSIPEADRPEGYQDFIETMGHLGQGLNANGLEFNYTQPVQGLLETFQGLATEHEEYLPAYQLFLHELAHTEEIAPEVEMPETIRNAAQHALEENTGFSLSHVLENTLGSPEFWGMTLLGTLAAGLGELGLIRGAGTSGRLGALVRGGRVTAWGHWAIGTGVALTMNVVGSAIHAARRDDYDFWSGDNWYRIATGSLFAGAAIGLTIGFGPFMARRFGITPGSRPSSWQRFGLTTSSLGLGTGAMGLASMGNRAFHTGEWEFNGEEWAETAITLGAFYGMHRYGWQPLGNRFFPRAMLGPHQMVGVEMGVESLVVRNPELAAQRPALSRYLARQFARGRFPFEIVEEMNPTRDRVPLFDPAGDTPLQWITRAEYVSLRGREIHRSREFQTQLRQTRATARALLESRPERSVIWVEISRDADGTLIMEPTLQAPRDRSRHFTIDRHGNLDNLSGLSDTVLNDALMREVQERQASARAIIAGEGPNAETVFQLTRRISGDPQHPFYRNLRRAFQEASRRIREQLDQGSSDPEVFIRFERDLSGEGGDLIWEILDQPPADGQMEGVLRVTPNGYSNSAVNEAIPSRDGDMLLRSLLNTLAQEFFPAPITPSIAGGAGSRAARPTDATVGIRAPAPRARGRTPRSVPQPPPPPPRPPAAPQSPALPAVTDFAPMAESLRERYPDLTREQIREAGEILASRSFKEGIFRAQMEVSTTTGSYGTHPTINVYRTPAGEYYFMIEGTPPPAGEHWGSFQIAQMRIIEVRSQDPVFTLTLREGMEFGPLALQTVAGQFPTAAPPSPPPPPPSPPPPPPARPRSSSGTGDPIGGTTQRRAVSQTLRERSRQRGDEPTAIIPPQQQAPLREESRSGPMPQEEPAASPEEILDVDPEELMEIDPAEEMAADEAGGTEALLPPDARPTRRPSESPAAAVPDRLPRPTPVPTDLTDGVAPTRTPTPPPLPSRRATPPPATEEGPAVTEPTTEDSLPIPLTRRVEREMGGLSAQDTLRLEGIADQIEIQRLASEMDALEIPHAATPGSDTRFERIYVVHNPGEQPAFSILPEGIVQRMASSDPNLGFFILNRQLVWNPRAGESGNYEVRGVRWSRGHGLPDSLTGLLQRIFNGQ